MSMNLKQLLSKRIDALRLVNEAARSLKIPEKGEQSNEPSMVSRVGAKTVTLNKP